MNNLPVTSQLREVPLSACRLEAGDVTVEKTENGKTPIKLRARTGNPVTNWYWGKLVHDMAGFQKPASIPLDYCHDDEQVLGYGDQFDAGNDGLDIGGFLVSLATNDRADEVAQKKRMGVPYQASIFFDPLSIEELMPGAKALVNGQTIEGPACIIRTWGLRGCAVCPYGNDPGTNVELAAKMSTKLHVPQITSLDLGAPKMSTPATNSAQPETAVQQSTPAATPAAAAPASSTPSVDPRAGFLSELKKFNEAFGPQGSVWLSEGKSFEEAALLHIKAQGEQLSAKDKELADAKVKLSAVPRGETAPVSMTPADPAPAGGAAASKADKLSALGAVGKYALSLKMPGAK